MTLTFELKPEVENLLRQVARERGMTVEEILAQRLELAERLDFSKEELEDLEDEIDLAAVRRAREEDDPAQRKTLDDLRAAFANRPVAA